MANKQSLLQRYRNVVISGLLLAGLLIVPADLLAAPYGSGSYDGCKYSQGCDASGGPIATPPSGQGSIILLNDYREFFTEDGKTLDMGVSETVHFNLTINGQLEAHTITIKQVGENFVILTFAPDSFDVTLNIGQSGQYDVNSDGKNDIKITLNSTGGGRANLSYSAVLDNATIQPSKDEATPVGTTSSQKNSSWLWLILSILAILAAIFIFFILWWRRRKRKDEPGMWQPPTPTA